MRASLHGARRVTQALDWTLEVLPARTSKAEGLRRLLEHLQINPRRVMAVGDGENDIEMMQMVGLPVATRCSRSRGTSPTSPPQTRRTASRRRSESTRSLARRPTRRAGETGCASCCGWAAAASEATRGPNPAPPTRRGEARRRDAGGGAGAADGRRCVSPTGVWLRCCGPVCCFRSTRWGISG